MDIFISQSIAGLPMPVAIILTIGAPVLVGLLLGRIVTSLFTPQELIANNEVSGSKYGFVVETYAVIAALSLVGSWDIYQNARDNLQNETGGLYMLALSIDTYAGPDYAADRAEMRAAIRGYAADVVAEDWPAMQAGQASVGSDSAFQRMVRAFFDVEPTTQAQQALAQNIVAWIYQVSDARIARLSVMSRTLSGLIWALVLTSSISVIAFQWFFGGASNALHFAIGTVIAVLVGAVMLISLRLAFPFIGDPPLLSPRPFLELMQVN